MSKENKENKPDDVLTTQSASAPAASAAPAVPQDLSEAIRGSMDKLPGEEVKSVWLYENYYRCNWWVREAQQGNQPGPAYLSSGKITRSKFLRATMKDNKLVIEDLSRRS